MCQDMPNRCTLLDPKYSPPHISLFINDSTLYDDVVCYIILELYVTYRITLYDAFDISNF